MQTLHTENVGAAKDVRAGMIVQIFNGSRWLDYSTIGGHEIGYAISLVQSDPKYRVIEYYCGVDVIFARKGI